MALPLYQLSMPCISQGSPESRRGRGGGAGGEENSLSPASLENGSGQVLSQESWWAVLG